MKKSLVLLFFCLMQLGAYASPHEEHVGTFNDWQVYKTSGQAKTCYIIGLPKKKEGAYTSRGPTYLVITTQLSPLKKDALSFAAGYPIKEGKKVFLNFKGTTFKLHPDTVNKRHDTAWAGDEEKEKKIITHLKSGRNLTVESTSEKNTNTKDSYDLTGFSKAYAAYRKACPTPSSAIRPQTVTALREKPSALTKRPPKKKKKKKKKKNYTLNVVVEASLPKAKETKTVGTQTTKTSARAISTQTSTA
jgi:hypothetical protein